MIKPLPAKEITGEDKNYQENEPSFFRSSSKEREPADATSI